MNYLDRKEECRVQQKSRKRQTFGLESIGIDSSKEYSKSFFL